MYPLINAYFSDMHASYCKHNKLNAAVQEIMDGLLAEWNRQVAKAKEDGKKPPGKPTSCCLQLSHSLNAAGVKLPKENGLPASVLKRDNACPKKGNGYYARNVMEIEVFLKKYGVGTEISAGKKSQDEMKAMIFGRTGILVFRDEGFGYHTELWDGHDILQRSGISGAMSEDGIFKQPRVLFWEVGKAQSADTMPDWLRGWWSVNDGDQYYYHFLGQDVVYWMDARRPVRKTEVAPHDLRGNYGSVTMTPTGLRIDWAVKNYGDRSTVETFTGNAVGIKGTSNQYAALTGKKLFA